MDDKTYNGSIDELAAAEERTFAFLEKRFIDSPLGNESVNQLSEEEFRLPVVVDAGDLLSRQFPPRERLLVPWLTSQ